MPHTESCETSRMIGDAFVMPPFLEGPAELDKASGPAPGWLWHGLLAPGAMTLFVSQWKTGKTTLASVLLTRMTSGGQLAGLPVAAGRAVVITEESPHHWRRRHQELGFGDNVGWFCRPFRGRPCLRDWTAFVDGLAELHDRRPFALALVDPLAAFLPGGENSAGAMLDALLPLQRLLARNVSVLVMHHPAKNDRGVGQAARGTGALPGHVDIIVEMRTFAHAAEDDRRRRLWIESRFPESPTNLVIEWTEDGTDYLARGTFQEEEFGRRWHRLRAVLAAAPTKLTRQDIIRRWKSSPTPDRNTLRDWLKLALSTGRVRQDGKGHKNNPYRYWLPEKEDEWRQDDWACALMPELRGEGEKAS